MSKNAESNTPKTDKAASTITSIEEAWEFARGLERGQDEIIRSMMEAVMTVSFEQKKAFAAIADALPTLVKFNIYADIKRKGGIV